MHFFFFKSNIKAKAKNQHNVVATADGAAAAAMLAVIVHWQ